MLGWACERSHAKILSNDTGSGAFLCKKKLCERGDASKPCQQSIQGGKLPKQKQSGVEKPQLQISRACVGYAFLDYHNVALVYSKPKSCSSLLIGEGHVYFTNLNAAGAFLCILRETKMRVNTKAVCWAEFLASGLTSFRSRNERPMFNALRSPLSFSREKDRRQESRTAAGAIAGRK